LSFLDQVNLGVEFFNEVFNGDKVVQIPKQTVGFLDNNDSTVRVLPQEPEHFIREGKVRLSVLSKQGKEATIALLGKDDFLGEGCIASDQPLRLATATAITECSILRIEKSRMIRTLHEQHEFSDMFVG
jgi:CRP-like cAMP-binding protein